MKIGVQFFVTGYTIDAATLGKALEEAGFESYWAPEHAVLPARPAMDHPTTGGRIPDVYGQMADPFVVLGMMATATTTLKLGTGVCLVPEHHPLILAKTVSTLDNFSGGRVLFGIGTGWLPEVTTLLNPRATKPWKYTREAVAAMTTLWRDGRGAYDGELVAFPEVICDPVPVQRPRPPVIIGAQPTPLACKRIAEWGDGWLANGVTPEQVADGRKAITAECERIGRDPGTVEISVGVRDPGPEARHAYEAAGADRLVISLYNHPGTPIPMARWAELGAATIAPPPSAESTLRALDFVRERAGM